MASETKDGSVYILHPNWGTKEGEEGVIWVGKCLRNNGTLSFSVQGSPLENSSPALME